MAAAPALIPPLRVALAQIDARVGDLEGNAARIAEQIGACARRRRRAGPLPRAGADRLPARGPAAQGALPARRQRGRRRLAPEPEGSSRWSASPSARDDVYNALAVLADGEVQAVYRKWVLPNYGVFDEERYFQVGEGGACSSSGDARLGLTICEDIWTPGPPAPTRRSPARR